MRVASGKNAPPLTASLLALRGGSATQPAPPLAPLLALRGGLDAKWTANGEAPAPYSTNARQQMGMDPQQMAGMMGGAGGAPQAPPQAPGALLTFSLLSLLVMYIMNNWKLVEGVQDFVMKVISPFTGAMEAKREAEAKAAAAADKEAARKARVARLKAAKGKASSSD